MFSLSETTRLHLVEFLPEHAPAIFSWASDPSVMTYMGWGMHRTLEDTQAAVKFFAEESAKGSSCAVAIVRKSDGMVLGSTGWGFDSPESGVTGWILRNEAQGQGYASEAMTALLAVAFRDFPALKRMDATIHSDNLASRRLAEKIGMRDTGETRLHVCPNLDGKKHAMGLYRIERP